MCRDAGTEVGMAEDKSKREDSTKPEVDDLNDYQSLNSSGGARVAADPEEVAPLINPDEDDAGSIRPAPGAGRKDSVTAYDGDYNDGADFNIADGEGRTNT
jgi:hypothetical protein